MSEVVLNVVLDVYLQIKVNAQVEIDWFKFFDVYGKYLRK